MRSDVALNIMTDKATQAPELRELEFIQHLRRQNPGPSFTLPTRSTSTDLAERHLCIVTEMALRNLLSLAEQSFAEYIIPEHGTNTSVRDVLSALDYVHNVCNIIHTGPFVLHSRVLSNVCVDVKITNVMMTASHEEMPKEGLGALIPAQLHTFPASTDNDTPVTVTKSIQIVPDLNDPEVWLSFSFKLTRLWYKTDKHFTQEVCPVGIRPPEVALRAGWGKPVDIEHRLHACLSGSLCFPFGVILLFLPAYQLQALGEFPASLRNRSRISKAWFNDDGSLRRKDVFPKKSFEALMEEQSGGALTLSSDCLHFMRRMLTLETDERASIEELLRHQWLN
ncbi:hypothetical protein EV421DRAFT_1906834 [Armillaria borealis]|uniref:non-specific serine/threonine protein kinase n=1 Tax=Armillaria borealis TaxID=47425 RepID=A0AA39JAA3_9AGAR|nr:hypothetical protein EV421DRAFT_1906834 [Armillaria borealis]